MIRAQRLRVEFPAVIALGSNLGDRRIALERACAALAEEPGLRILERSPIYETEPVEAAKALKDFSAKSKGVLEIKGGISDGKAVSADDVKAIAELPTKDQLLGQIAGLISGFARDIAVCVNGVSSGLARSIQQVSEQKAA